jgi:hypothetical protein
VSAICSLTLRDERKYEYYGNNMLKRIVGFKGDHLTGGTRKLRRLDLYMPYTPLYFVRLIN